MALISKFITISLNNDKLYFFPKLKNNITKTIVNNYIVFEKQTNYSSG